MAVIIQEEEGGVDLTSTRPEGRRGYRAQGQPC